MKNKIRGKLITRSIFIDGELLCPAISQKVYNHSPDGFNWGYGGSGPAQLALAILLKFTDKDTALYFYQDFKWEVIAKLPQGDFEIDIDIKKWIKEFKGGDFKYINNNIKNIRDIKGGGAIKNLSRFINKRQNKERG